MEILSGKNNIESNYPISNPSADKGNTSFIDSLSGIFFLSDEEKLKAGIYVGAKGREWIEKGALIIPAIGKDQDN